MNESPPLDAAAVEIPAESSEQKIEAPSPQVEQTPQRHPHFAGFRKWILLGAVCIELGLLVGLVAKPSPKPAEPAHTANHQPTIPELAAQCYAGVDPAAEQTGSKPHADEHKHAH